MFLCYQPCLTLVADSSLSLLLGVPICRSLSLIIVEGKNKTKLNRWKNCFHMISCTTPHVNDCPLSSLRVLKPNHPKLQTELVNPIMTRKKMQPIRLSPLSCLEESHRVTEKNSKSRLKGGQGWHKHYGVFLSLTSSNTRKWKNCFKYWDFWSSTNSLHSEKK